MATNLHALHLVYAHKVIITMTTHKYRNHHNHCQVASLYGAGSSKASSRAVAANASVVVDNAMLVDLLLHDYSSGGSSSKSSSSSGVSINRTSCKGNDVEVALKWAAPSVEFQNTHEQVPSPNPNHSTV